MNLNNLTITKEMIEKQLGYEIKNFKLEPLYVDVDILPRLKS